MAWTFIPIFTCSGLTSQLIDVKPEDVTIGMKVQASFRKLGQEGEAGVIHYGYKFRPASG